MTLEEVRELFRAARCHHVLLPGVLGPEAAGTLRTELAGRALARFDEPDRGRYEFADEPARLPIIDEMRALAEQVVERPLEIARATWLRLSHRDYLLLKGDAGTRLPTAHMEVTLDFSAAATGSAELVYTDGYESWPVFPEPGSVAIVRREPWVFRYDRYLPHTVGDHVVHRLRLLLA